MTHRFPIKEIARQAGLGVATIDRVLNNRAAVSPQTRARVMAAMDELQHQEQQLSARGRRMFVDVVVEAPRRFSSEIRRAAETVAPSIGAGVFRPRFTFQEVMPDADILRILTRILKRGSQGVCLKARDVVGVRDMVDRMQDAGIPVVTLVTDLSATKRCAYVGLDNANAGRTAAYLLARSLPDGGTVLATRSQNAFYGEAERLDHFRTTLRDLCPNARIIEATGGGGLATDTARHLTQVLANVPRLDAVYSMGGGNPAILNVLDGLGHRALTYIAHDLDAENRALLGQGRLDFVLHHDLMADMRRMFDAIAAHHRLAAAANVAPSDVQIITPFNVPK